ncbi:MAG: hypothetical protein JWR35_2293 [Marmoricola sp.]|jgi:hypothetical protein|nr:hypothetical protein [Marmoricola sp.]
MSTPVRIYVPATLARLAGYVADGGIGPPPIAAHAVTEALQEEWADGSEDEWEYAALMAAAEDSAALLGPEDRPRRVVLAVDVPRVTAGELTAVTVDEAIALRLVAAVHVDTEDIDPAAGDGPDLGWFATQEIGDLLALG